MLVDAGPLVALINADDRWSEPCRRTWAANRTQLLTVWPAISEAMYLLRRSSKAQDALWEFLESGSVIAAPIEDGDFPRMRELMRKYRDLPMDLADAALVRVAERERIRRIFTTDGRDFETYRLYRLGRFEILP